MYQPGINDSTVPFQLSEPPTLSTFTSPPPLPPVSALADPKSTKPPDVEHISTALAIVADETTPDTEVRLSGEGNNETTAADSQPASD